LGSRLHTAGGAPEFVLVSETGTGEGNGTDFTVNVGPGVYHLAPADGSGVYGTFTVAGDGTISATTGAATATGNTIDFDLSKLAAVTIFASDLMTATGRQPGVNVFSFVGMSYSPYVDTIYFPAGKFELNPFDAGGHYGGLTIGDDGTGSLVVTGTSGAAVATDNHTIHFDLSKLAAVTVFGSDIKTANGQQQTLNLPNFVSLFGEAYATDTIYFPACTVKVTPFDRPGVYGSFTVADNGSGSLVVTGASGAAVATDNHTIHFDLSKLAAVTIFGSELITAPAYLPIGIQGFLSLFHADPIDTVYFPACTVNVTNFDASVQYGTFTVADIGSGVLAVTATTGKAVATDPHTIHFNAPPVVGPISGVPLAPVPLNTTVSFGANFTDADVADTHTALWNWGDSTTSAAAVTEVNGSGTVTGSHTYTVSGVYTVALTVTDNPGASGQSVFRFVVVYDPIGGFVTGGGWINSPVGAYTANPSLTGKANFGFESRYQNGNSVPTGNTEFQVKVGNLNFKSVSYEWLVMSGAKARFRGTGTVNGSGTNGFELTAWDGQANGGGGTDRFRIKIWNANQGNGVVYDSMMGAPDGADPTTTLGGGSIVIHKLDPLLAAGGPRSLTVAAPTPRLTAASLQRIVAAAIDRWAAAGLDAIRLGVMRNATFTIDDLGESYLGLADADTHGIRIDDDAAGNGWFVDPTPNDDSEFTRVSGRSVRGRMDLLSVVAHELGHLVGLDDKRDASHVADVMGDTLATGTRRLPTSADVGQQPIAATPTLPSAPWARHRLGRRR